MSTPTRTATYTKRTRLRAADTSRARRADGAIRTSPAPVRPRSTANQPPGAPAAISGTTITAARRAAARVEVAGAAGAGRWGRPPIADRRHTIPWQAAPRVPSGDISDCMMGEGPAVTPAPSSSLTRGPLEPRWLAAAGSILADCRHCARELSFSLTSCALANNPVAEARE